MEIKSLKVLLLICVVVLFIYHTFLIEIEAPHRIIYLIGNFLNIVLSGLVPSIGLGLVLACQKEKKHIDAYHSAVHYHLNNITSNFEEAFKVLPKNETKEELKKFGDNFFAHMQLKVKGGTVHTSGYGLLLTVWGNIDRELKELSNNDLLAFDETNKYINDFHHNDFYEEYKRLKSTVSVGGDNLNRIVSYNRNSMCVIKKEIMEKRAIYIPKRSYEEYETLKENIEKMYKK